MDKYTTLLTNFLDARFYHYNNPHNPSIKAAYDRHEKALNDYMEEIERGASKGAARASLDMIMK